jgi:DNA-nicking Smr family endonuclease
LRDHHYVIQFTAGEKSAVLPGGDIIVAKIVLDLHEIFNKGQSIDSELNRVISEAVDKKINLVEIIPGKGSGQLKKRVLRFLAQPDIKQIYHRIEKDDKNFGRIFVHFKF